MVGPPSKMWSSTGVKGVVKVKPNGKVTPADGTQDQVQVPDRPQALKARLFAPHRRAGPEQIANTV